MLEIQGLARNCMDHYRKVENISECATFLNGISPRSLVGSKVFEKTRRYTPHPRNLEPQGGSGIYLHKPGNRGKNRDKEKE
ncbi:hypothetical protein ACFL35_21845 [Candidatus Riflebacteria bacterium]